MRIAALADIHGNADALRAVLADVANFAPDLIVNLGDCFSGPLKAGETADLLIAHDFPTVMGNHDRWLVDRRSPDGAWESAALRQLSMAHLKWIRSLPATCRIGGAFLCHATPQDDLTYWLHQVSPTGEMLPSQPDRIAAHLEGLPDRLFLCGHTHLPRAVRLPDGRMVVNPGSVGGPGYSDDHPVPHRVETGNPFAAYAILDQHGADWAVTFRQVPYDPSDVVRLALAQGDAESAAALATGWLPKGELPASE